MAQRTPELPLIWHQSTLKSGIKSIGATCMLAAPWEEPAALKRCWCLLQMQHSLAVNNKISFVLGEKDAKVRRTSAPRTPHLR